MMPISPGASPKALPGEGDGVGVGVGVGLGVGVAAGTGMLLAPVKNDNASPAAVVAGGLSR